MAYGDMADAVAGQIASAAEYNKHKAHIEDLDTRLDSAEASIASGTTGNTALGTRVTTLETRTTDTVTTGGIGNQRLADRLGTGVGTGTNVTTGNAESQLGNLRTRATAVEARATTLEGQVGAAGSSPNINTRLNTLEAAAGTVAPLVMVTRATAQTIGNNTETAMSWSSAPRNPNTMWAAGNPTRITIPSGQSGLYLLTGALVFNINGTGGRTVHLRKNGTGDFRRMGSTPGITSIHSEMTFAYPVELVAGDYFEIFVWQNSGGNLDVRSGSTGGSDDTPYVLIRKVAT